MMIANMNHCFKAVPFIVLLIASTAAAHEFNEEDQLGYRCSRTLSCAAQLIFTAAKGQSLEQISSQFQARISQIQAANNNNLTNSFAKSQLLLLPLHCSCDSSTNRSFSQAIEAANKGLLSTNLTIGDSIQVPLRCGCSEDDLLLVTYVLGESDSTASAVSAKLGVTESEILLENGLQDANFSLEEQKTLLIPVRNGSKLVLPAIQDSAEAPAKNPNLSNSENDQESWKFYLGVTCGALGLCILIGTAVVLILLKKRSSKSTEIIQKKLSDPHFSLPLKNNASSKSAAKNSNNNHSRNSSVKLSISGMSDLMDADKPIWYSLEELHKATGGFDSAHRILDSSVYAAVLRGIKVAIKRSSEIQTSSIARILCRLHHTNLIALLGACHDEQSNQTFLVYEYADRGALAQCIPTLDWKNRLRVALEVATALEYLHEYAKPGFVHRNISSSNVLLDGALRAKIANFHTATASNAVLAESHSFSKSQSSVVGTGRLGYLAPEYMLHGKVTPKTDVYAFGVVLLELVTGLGAVVRRDSAKKGRLFDEFFLSEILCSAMDGTAGTASQEVERRIDPLLLKDDATAVQSATAVAFLARACLQKDPQLRPTMRDVACTLSKLTMTMV